MTALGAQRTKAPVPAKVRLVNRRLTSAAAASASAFAPKQTLTVGDPERCIAWIPDPLITEPTGVETRTFRADLRTRISS